MIPSLISILTTSVRSEHDVMLTRHRARQIAGLLGFDLHDQTRIAAAVSEIARNAVQHAGGGKVEFQLVGGEPQIFLILVEDSGPGIPDSVCIPPKTGAASPKTAGSIPGVRRLMNVFEITSTPGKGALVKLGRVRPRRLPPIGQADLPRITQKLMERLSEDPVAEMQLQNQELLHTLDELRAQQEQRERDQEAIRLREQWLATTLRSIEDAVIATDADGGILFMNPAAEGLTGCCQKDAIGKAAHDVCQLVSRQTHQEVESPFEAVLHRGATPSVPEDCVLIAGDGTHRFLDHSGGPIRDEAGQVIGAVLVFRDITTRIAAQQERDHLMEQLLARVREIENLNIRLKRSIQETHHRVKNNLQIISALVEIQTGDEASTIPATAMARIGHHTRSLATLHDLLTQQAKADVQTDCISTAATLDKLAPLLQSTTGGRRILYQVEDISLPVQDGASLALLISETISNAVKHGKGDIELSFQVQGKDARLEICDDGPGFPEGFDPQRDANTGLGLIDSIGRYELGGTIVYENRPKGGARVVITFPLPENPA